MSDKKTYEFVAEMSCSGCSGAIERALGKWKTKDAGAADIEYSTDLEKKTVTVIAPAELPYQTIYDKINLVKPVSAGREITA
ncbi:hypothetical protein DRE_04884 [Drechslerella stenobrocha 248]|uniref:Uncharacterized protein n=1 Tax=Drechslerella stenobrocha 248 TaxID=1043628 RepID=W7I070_9PEZI|nr:hypothetical protein DRE_04884 [Drechslerella stenobrocha 248]